MRLINFQHHKKGQYLEDAWLSLGKFYPNGVFFRICLPLFVIGKRYFVNNYSYRFGWWIPTIHFIFEPQQIRWWFYFKFHSDFMGEVEETDGMGYALDDPLALRNLGVYRR